MGDASEEKTVARVPSAGETAIATLEVLGNYLIDLIDKAERAKHGEETDWIERRYYQGRADALRSLLPYVREYATKTYIRYRDE